MLDILQEVNRISCRTKWCYAGGESWQIDVMYLVGHIEI